MPATEIPWTYLEAAGLRQWWDSLQESHHGTGCELVSSDVEAWPLGVRSVSPHSWRYMVSSPSSPWGQELCSVGGVALSTKTPSNILKEFLLSFL